jgi:phosphatidylglycerol:prolipoprotein diacylglycerol transferase
MICTWEEEIPSLALGLFLGRIGCFLAGCNGGTVSGLPWAVRFSRDTPVYYQQETAGLLEGRVPLSLPAHPTQLYESLFGLIAFVLLLCLLRQPLPQGQVFLTGMFWYSTYRFATEFLRADAGGLCPLGLFTFSQLVSLLLALASLLGLIHLRFRQRPSVQAPARD